MVHILKIYYKGQNNEMQIRRLAVNSEVVSKFDLLAQKIKEIYPVLAQQSFDVTWKDPENDVIHMSSDEELAQALANAEEGLLKIFVYSSDFKPLNNNEVLGAKSSHNELHPQVICDSCDQSIHGYRYKCLQCRNYDLCSACNAANKHDNHDMVKLVRPSHVAREWVFLGSRKLWRSMFGRTSCFQNYWAKREEFMKGRQEEDEKASQKEPQASKSSPDQSPDEKAPWHAVIDDLLKGDFVPAEKLIKENLGNFLNFVDSVAGGVDVRIENCPFKPGPFPMDKKATDFANTNEEKAKEDTKQNDATSSPKEEPLQAQSSEHVNDKDSSEETKPKETAVLVDLESASAPASQQAKEYSPPPTGLFCDVESSVNADGWTLVSGQDAEKKDNNNTASCVETGAKPKSQVMYPVIPEAAQATEIPPAQPNEGYKQNEHATTTQNPEILNALYKMQAMGFTNEGGWLERLLITKDGNINAALDALYPNTRRQ